jgi:hypothetical protein
VKVVAIGLGLTLAVTALLVSAWGRVALAPGVLMGLLATAIQWEATRRLQREYRGSTPEFFKAVGAGMALRMAGVLLMLAAIVLDRALFAPLPTAFGFLGVVIPLLFLEARLVR